MCILKVMKRKQDSDVNNRTPLAVSSHKKFGIYSSLGCI